MEYLIQKYRIDYHLNFNQHKVHFTPKNHKSNIHIILFFSQLRPPQIHNAVIANISRITQSFPTLKLV